MFKFLIICVAILVNVETAPSAEPQLDIFSFLDDLYDYFFESDENETVENQTIYINCKNCTVKINATSDEMTMTTTVPTTTGPTTMMPNPTTMVMSTTTLNDTDLANTDKIKPDNET